MDNLLKPTTDPDPAPNTETESEITPEPNFVPWLKPSRKFDKMRDPVTLSFPVGILVEYKGMDWSPTHTLTAEGELSLVSAKLFEEVE